MSQILGRNFTNNIVNFITDNAVLLIVTSALAGVLTSIVVFFFNNNQVEKEADEDEKPAKERKSKGLTNDEMMELLMKGKGKINPNFIFSEPVETKSEVRESKKQNPTKLPVVHSSTDSDSSSSNEDEVEKKTTIPTQDQPSTSENSSMDDSDQLKATLGKLHGKLNTAQLKVQARLINEKMTQEEKDYETMMRAKQMESIMALMMENKEKFGMTNEEDIKEQLNLYNF